MTKQLVEAFSSLSSDQQCHLLAWLSLELTIVGRDAYARWADSAETARRLRVVNEVQHTISGQLLPLIESSKRRFPDDTFLAILEEGLEAAGPGAPLLERIIRSELKRPTTPQRKLAD